MHGVRLVGGTRTGRQSVESHRVGSSGRPVDPRVRVSGRPHAILLIVPLEDPLQGTTAVGIVMINVVVKVDRAV